MQEWQAVRDPISHFFLVYSKQNLHTCVKSMTGQIAAFIDTQIRYTSGLQTMARGD